MRGAFRHSTEVQTVLFDVSAFTPAAARAWARKHGFGAPKVDVTDRYIRLRQRGPSAYRRGTFRTITLTDGVLAVVGVPKVGGNLKPRQNAGHGADKWHGRTAYLIDFSTGRVVRKATPEEHAASVEQSARDGIGIIVIDGREYITETDTFQNPARRNTGAGAHFEDARAAVRRALAARGTPDYRTRYTEAARALALAERHREQTAPFAAARRNGRAVSGGARPTRTAQVNAYLAAHGFPGVMLHCSARDAYCHFYGGEAARWEDVSVYVPRVRDLTLDAWLSEARRLAATRRNPASRGNPASRLEMLHHHLKDVEEAAQRHKPGVAHYLYREAAAYLPRKPRRNGAERVTVPGMGQGVIVAHRPGGMCDVRLSGGQVVRKPKSTLKPVS